MIKHEVVIIGGGTAGIMVASQLLEANPKVDIAVIEPSSKHIYQPAWTLVGANTFNYDSTIRPMFKVMPKRAKWYKDYAQSFNPDINQVETRDGIVIQYDYLVVCPGIKIDPSMVPGLAEVMDKGMVCSNYTDPRHSWQVQKKFKGGTALFTQAATPIKCGGAPQKMMYLADDYFRKKGVRNKTTMVYAIPGSTIFGVPEIRETLLQVVDRKDIYMRTGHKLVRVEGEKQIAWFELTEKFSEYNQKDIPIVRDGDLVGIKFDMMHLAPPQKAPEFISNSPLASDSGWIDVNQETLQHIRYSNVFGLGDAAQLPTGKTGAAIRKQAPLIVSHIINLMKNGQISEGKYNGYSSCPIVTGYGKMVLAEFDYNNNFIPDPKLKRMLVFRSWKESWRLWILKKYILPFLYWNKILKGKEV